MRTKKAAEEFKYPEVLSIKPKYRKLSDVLLDHTDTYFTDFKPPAAAPIVPLKTEKSTIVLVLSDTHAGKLTPKFNIKIHNKRGTALFQEVARLAKSKDIDEIVILLLGDHTDGETIYPSHWREIEFDVYSQYLKVAEIFSSWILGLNKVCKKPIRVATSPGNHGRIGYKNDNFDWKANWDMFAFHLISKILAPYNIPVDIKETWDGRIEIKNKTFLITHGDRVQGGGDPGTIEKAYEGWLNSLGWQFDAAICGHWHAPHILNANGRPIFINGTFVSGDPYTTGTIKKYCPASSKILLVNNRNITCTDFILEGITDE